MARAFFRILGGSGISVSSLGLGCWAIGGPAWRGETPVGWGQVDDQESVRAVKRALEVGITFFDTADAYGAGHSEKILANALAGKRDRVVIATKFGNTYDEEAKQLSGSNASEPYIRQACEASLRRLNTDYIDLYQFHIGNYDIGEAEGVRDVLEDLVKQGKIRSYGWSTDDPDRAAVFARGDHCASVQFQFNVLRDNPDMIQLCDRMNIAGINRGPLAMGLLSGKYNAASELPADDVRGKNAPGWMRYFTEGKPNPEFLEKLQAIREILQSGGRSLVQGALAWIWARSSKTVPIPGFKTVAQVEENAKAMEYGPLGFDEMGEIDRILER
jgi:aryl-alcohol dehydrogenase-like predicted oxidoreductase